MKDQNAISAKYLRVVLPLLAALICLLTATPVLAGSVICEIYSAPDSVAPDELVDIQVRIKYSPASGDGSGPWNVVEIKLKDDDVTINDTIATYSSPGAVNAATWKYYWFYNIRLSDWDDGGDGVELFVHAEVEDPWANPSDNSPMQRIPVVDPDPTATKVTPSSPITLDYDTNQSFTARGRDDGGDLDYADWTLSGPENDTNHDYFTHSEDINSSYSHTFDMAGDYTLTCVFTDESGDTASVSWSIHVNVPPKTDTRFRWVETDPSPMIQYQQGTLKAKLEDNSYWNYDLPNKTVKFYVDNTFKGSDVTDDQGEVSISYTHSSEGTFQLKAVFEGDSSYNATDKTVTVTVNTLPNYIVSDLSMSSDQVRPNDRVYLKFWVENIGQGAGGSSELRWYYGMTENVPSVEIGHASIAGIDGLAPSEEEYQSAVWTIPENMSSGQYYLIAKADADGEVTESDDEHNLKSIPFTISSKMTPSADPSQNDFYFDDHGQATNEDTPLGDRIPVILVHGNGGDNKPYSLNYWYWWSRDYFNAPEHVGRFKVYRYVYYSSRHIAENGTQFAAFVNSYPELQGKRIIIVAHSMGGLVSRYALNTNQELRQKTIRLITLGTPHLGSPGANPCWVYATAEDYTDEEVVEWICTIAFNGTSGDFDLSWYNRNEVPLESENYVAEVLNDFDFSSEELAESRLTPFTGTSEMSAETVSDNLILAFGGYLGSILPAGGMGINPLHPLIFSEVGLDHAKLFLAEDVLDNIKKRSGVAFTENDGLVPRESAMFVTHSKVQALNITSQLGQEYLDHSSYLDSATVMDYVMECLMEIVDENGVLDGNRR